jgi:hypothetical protein
MMKTILIKMLLLVIPILLTPVWYLLLTTGIISFGGGEKDLLVLVPYLLWAILYLGSGAIFWKHAPRRMVLSGIMYSIITMLILWVAILVYSFTG